MKIALSLLLILVFFQPGCVYFNTYYNAQKLFRQAEKTRQEEERERQLLGEAALQGIQRPRSKADGLYDKAARKASKVLEEHPESDLVDDAMFMLGRSFFWQEDYSGAISSFGDLENFPQSEYIDQARYWRGLAHEKQGATREARQIYLGLVNDGSGQVAEDAAFRLGEIAFDEEKYVAAIQEYRNGLETFASSRLKPTLWLRTGEALLALEDSSQVDEALAALDSALAAKPEPEIEYRARLSQGKVFYRQGHSEKALAAYLQLLKESRFRPFEGQTRNLIGQYYEDQDELDRALEEFARVRDDFPLTASSAMAVYRTGLLYLRLDEETERGRDYLEEVRREKAGSEADRLAQIKLKELRELERLVRRIERADSVSAMAIGDLDALATSSISVDSLIAQATPARVLDVFFDATEVLRDPERLDQPEKAAEYYREIIRRFPETVEMPRVLYGLAWIYDEARGEPEVARPYLEELVERFPTSEQASTARRILGIEEQDSDEDHAMREYRRLENLQLQAEIDPEAYVAGLDSLVATYPATRTGAKAAFMAAWTIENTLGDTAMATRRYKQVPKNFPKSRHAELVKERVEAERDGLVVRLERDLRAIGGQAGGDSITVIAVEPDSVDSTAQSEKEYGFGIRAHKRGKFSLAQTHYEASIVEKERNPDALYRLAQVQWKDGYTEDAADSYGAALRYNRRMIGVFYGLFDLHLAEGLADSANHYLNQILGQDRGNEMVGRLRDEHPEWVDGSGIPDLDLDELAELELRQQEDEFVPPASVRRLGDGAILRQPLKVVYPAGVSGDSTRVILDVLVDRKGKPETVEVFSGESPFIELAVEEAQKAMFFPAERTNGRKERVWVEIIVPFVPKTAAQVPQEAAQVAETGILPGESTPDFGGEE